MNTTRRQLLQAASAALIAEPVLALPGEPPLDAIPALPAKPTPGKAGDFDFLTGEWKIRNWRLPAGATAWDQFDGEATVHRILGGVGSVEELRIPARGFAGMGLRLLDVQKGVWIDHWVNAKNGLLTPPGLPGSFEQGTGLFWSDETENGKTTRFVSLWDRITPTSCRWRQASSDDGGRTWAHNWLMEWRRA